MLIYNKPVKDTGVGVFGLHPEQKELEVPSRHLGLSIDNSFCMDDFANRAAEIMRSLLIWIVCLKYQTCLLPA